MVKVLIGIIFGIAANVGDVRTNCLEDAIVPRLRPSSPVWIQVQGSTRILTLWRVQDGAICALSVQLDVLVHVGRLLLLSACDERFVH
ncbi:MAG: hypothetical protein Q7V48_08085 [Deltaproteobacteria bacterium]|nr:hypothetical protein [Deltaproteobacteria bacterium]MDO9210694.1 hypothetical protein [Deltaproteobacteria bacterium]